MILKMAVSKDKTKKKKDIESKFKNTLTLESDPRRQSFAVAYYDPLSDTYANALQSALKAGFAQEYAESILYKKPKWLSEIVGKMDIMEDLMRNFKAHVNLPIKVPAMGPFGPIIDKKTKKPYMVESNTRLKLRQEITMFGLEKLNPDFKKKDKFEVPIQPVVITQVIIKSPDGSSIIYDANPEKNTGVITNPETS